MNRINRHFSIFIILTFSSQILFAFWPQQMSSKTLALTEFYNSAGDMQNTSLGDDVYKQFEQVFQEDTRVYLQHATINKPEFATMETVLVSGRDVGADAILVGAYSEIGGMIKLETQLIEISTQNVLYTDTAYLMQGEKLSNELRNIARNVQKSWVGEPPMVNVPQQTVNPVQSEALQTRAAATGGSTKSAVAGGAGSSWLIWTAAGVGVAGGVYLLYNAINTSTSTVSLQVPLP